jgi:hypothetical protein
MTFPAGATITVGDITVSNVELGATSLAALETTELGTASLAALESVTANLTETGTSLTDKSGTITTGGTSQTLAAAKADRSVFIIQNLSDADIAYNIFGGTASLTSGSIVLGTKELHAWKGKECPVGAITVIGATTGQAFFATEV